jgi:hypothetical protein
LITPIKSDKVSRPYCFPFGYIWGHTALLSSIWSSGIDNFQHFEETYSPHLSESTSLWTPSWTPRHSKTKAVHSSKISGFNNHATWCNNPGNMNPLVICVRPIFTNM